MNYKKYELSYTESELLATVEKIRKSTHPDKDSIVNDILACHERNKKPIQEVEFTREFVEFFYSIG